METRTRRSLRIRTGQPLCQEDPTICSRSEGGIDVTEERNAPAALPADAASASIETPTARAFMGAV